MASQKNLGNPLCSSENLEPQPNNATKLLEEVKIEAGTATVEEIFEKEDLNDDNADVDLSAVEIASSLLDQTFALDDPEFNIPDNSNEAYKNIMGLCSSTAENIKKSIYEVLNSRENVVITEDDTTSQLQESLSKKMEDFKQVISGCSDKVVKADAASSSEGSESQPIESVTEEKEDGVGDLQTNSNKMPDSEGQSDKDETGVQTVLVASEKNVDVKDNDNAEKTVVDPNVHTNVTAAKLDDTLVKTNAKVFKPSEKKTETTSESPVLNTKTVSSSLLQSPNSLKDMLKNTVSVEEGKSSKKQRNGASKKKGEKNIDQVMKLLGNGTAEEKLQLLCKRYMDTVEEYRLVEPRLRQMERQIISQQREKEQLQAEHNRMILAKSRLEGLCREMQRQSKAVKEESLLRIKEEEEKRKEIANKFQATLNDISSLMQENSKKNIKLREENAELATKLKGLVDNYEIWEQNMSKVVQQKELEAQLAKAKHAKVNLLLKQETEKFLREKQSLLENLSELQKRCTVLTSNELQLRTELSDYTSKYEEFQSVLSNSSKVFSTFKNDMESTSKKIKKLEKETNVYKQKWESSNKALLDMISHKDKQDKDFSNAQQRILTLEKLCRALQAERNELQNQINIFTSNSVATTKTEVPSLSTETGIV